jgi:hypothetical protein
VLRKLKTKKEDPAAIPAFLRRPLTAAVRARTDSLLRQETVREWIMPDLSRYAFTNKVVDLYDDTSEQETDMAKKKTAPSGANGQLEVECQDPALPVEVNLHQDGGETVTKEFPDMQGFIDWFKPSLHVLDGSIADESQTMIEVTERPRPRADKKTIKEAEKVIRARREVTFETVDRGAIDKRKAGPKGKVEKVVKPRGVGFVRQKVRVGKTLYNSVFKAFEAIGLSIPAHPKFRAELKKTKDGKKTYEERGKKYLFEIVEEK